MSQTPVILIGGDHYNGLALVRVFAKYNIDAYGIIVGEGAEKGSLIRSRYWKDVKVLKDDEAIVPCLESFPNTEGIKPVVMPWSDGAAAELDRNLDRLKERFILPSIDGRQGAIYRMMDKKEQLSFAEGCGLPFAKSRVIDLYNVTGIDLIDFPCFCKPLISSEGDKKDMRRLDAAGQLPAYLDMLKSKGYKEVLIQDFLNIDNEFDIMGCCSADCAAYVISQKVRIWPNVGGPTSYSFTVDTPVLNDIAERVIKRLREMGYSGAFDVDLFKLGDRFFFNEINWRNSALCYIALNSGVDYPVIWYRSVTGGSTEGFLTNPSEFGRYSMNEFADIHHVLDGEISFGKWYRQYRSCTGFAYKDRRDPGPARARLTKAVLKKLGFHKQGEKKESSD